MQLFMTRPPSPGVPPALTGRLSFSWLAELPRARTPRFRARAPKSQKLPWRCELSTNCFGVVCLFVGNALAYLVVKNMFKQSQAKQSKVKQSNAKHAKAKQSQAKQSKAKESKTKQRKQSRAKQNTEKQRKASKHSVAKQRKATRCRREILIGVAPVP